MAAQRTVKAPVELRHRALAWCLLAAALVPLLVAFSPLGLTPAQDLPMLALALGAVAAVAAILVALREGRRPPAWPALGAAGVVLAFALAVPGASDRFAAVFGAPADSVGVAQMAAVVLLGIGAAALSDDIRDRLPQAALLALLLQVFFGLYELAIGRPLQGTLSNSAYLGQAVLLLAPFAMPEKPRSRWLLALPIALGALLAAGGALASAVLVAAWVAIALAGRSWTPRRRVAAIAAVAVATYALAAVLAFVPTGDALGGRRWYWPAVVATWQASPLTGAGAGSFRAELTARAPEAYFAYEAPNLASVTAVAPDPHDLALGALASGGLVALVALVAAAVALARRAHERLREQAVHVEPALTALLLFAATLAFQPAPLQTLPLAALVAGLATGWLAEQAPGALARPATVALAAVLALGALGTALLGATHVAIGAQGGTQTRASAVHAQRLADLWQADAYLYHEASFRWGYLGTQGDAGARDRDIAAASRAAAIAPRDGFYALELARVLRTYGAAPAQVRAAFERAQALAPGSTSVREEAAAAVP